LRENLRDAGEELDALRKRVLKDHPDLTLTGLYNVLEKLKASAELTDKDEDVKDRGLVLILKELHETINRLTAELMAGGQAFGRRGAGAAGGAQCRAREGRSCWPCALAEARLPRCRGSRKAL
jgi:hypothetical protein